MTLRRDARGASLVEQTLIVALVALVAIGAWAALGGAVEERVDCVAGAIGAGVSGPCAPVSASGDDGDARAARGAVRAPSPRASRESASVSAGAATGALSGRTIATGFGFATRAAPWATPSAAFRSPLVSPPSRRVFVPAPGSARGRGTATSLSDDATWAFDAAAAIWRAGLLNLVRVSDPDLRTAGARSTGAEARAAGARRAGVSSRTRAHRRPLGRFARRNRVAWQVALIALRVGTPDGKRTYARAVRIVRFVRQSWRRAARGVGTVRSALRRVVAIATVTDRRDRRARQLVAGSAPWHEYKRVWRRVHRTPNRWTWPVANPVVTSPFGWRTHPVTGERALHAGVDFAASTGTALRAVQRGTVISAGALGSAGNAVIIRLSNGWTVHYFHMSRVGVRAGQHVSRGQWIGAAGATGRVTGPHLHFELRRPDGTPVDPLPALKRWTR